MILDFFCIKLSIEVLWYHCQIFCHIRACVVESYCAHYYCLFTAWFVAALAAIVSWGPHTEGHREYSRCTTRYCPQNHNASKTAEYFIQGRCSGQSKISAYQDRTGYWSDAPSTRLLNWHQSDVDLGRTPRRPCSIQTGGAKLLTSRLHACWPCWHLALNKIHRFIHRNSFELYRKCGLGHLHNTVFVIVQYRHPSHVTSMIWGYKTIPHALPVIATNTQCSILTVQENTRLIEEDSIVL